MQNRGSASVLVLWGNNRYAHGTWWSLCRSAFCPLWKFLSSFSVSKNSKIPKNKQTYFYAINPTHKQQVYRDVVRSVPHRTPGTHRSHSSAHRPNNNAISCGRRSNPLIFRRYLLLCESFVNVATINTDNKPTSDDSVRAARCANRAIRYTTSRQLGKIE